MGRKRKAQALAEGKHKISNAVYRRRFLSNKPLESVSAYAARQARRNPLKDDANRASSTTGQIESAHNPFDGDALKKRAKKAATAEATFERKILASKDDGGQQPHDNQPTKGGSFRPDPANHKKISERLVESAPLSKNPLKPSTSVNQRLNTENSVPVEVERSLPKPQDNKFLNSQTFPSKTDLNDEGLYVRKPKEYMERQKLELQSSQQRDDSASLVLPSEPSRSMSKKRRRRMKFQAENIPIVDNSNISYIDSENTEERQRNIDKDFEDFRSSSESSDHPQPLTQRLSTFRQSPDSVLSECSTEWTVRIQEGEFLTLIGQYDIWVRKGAISIAGATLRPSSDLHRVYAPSTHALPPIRALRNPFGPQGNAEVTFITFNSGLRALRHLSPNFDRIWNSKAPPSTKPNSAMDPSQRTFTFLEYSSDHGHKAAIRPLQIPDGWQSLILKLASDENSHQPQAIMVCGPKGSGKSTFCRSLTNAMITKSSLKSPFGQIISRMGCVALLDIDPGQPEYSPPGEISLILIRVCNFGVPFSHPTPTSHGNQLIRSHHIGAFSPSDDPIFYIRCVFNLFERYKQLLTQFPSCPLVVNTAGWVQGKGLELVVDLIHNMRLSDIVYTSTEGPLEVTEVISRATVDSGMQFHCLNSQPLQHSTKPGADLRMMQTLSYIHLDEPENGKLRWNSIPITSMIPLGVHYAGPLQSFFAVHIPGDEVDPEYIIRVLEGSMIGLVAIEDDAALPMMENERTPSSTKRDRDISRLNHTQEDADAEDPENSTGQFDDHLQELAKPQASTKTIPETARNAYLSLPTLPRTPELIPYIPSTYGTAPPLDPNHSYSIGQAIICSIDTTQKLFRLITPVPTTTFNALHRQGTKIVFVRGKLDLPTWAYREELSMLAMMRKTTIKERIHEVDLERWGREDVKRWAEGKPWMSVEGRGRGERVRRARKDFGRRTARDESE